MVNIFVKEGDTVAKDQAILELENEKAVASIPSTGAGVVAKVHVKAGDRVGVGARLITVNESGQPAAAPAAPASASAPKPAAKKAAPVAAPEPEEADDSPAPEGEIVNENPVTSPSIRKMARELGIDLRAIRGSESGGRIVAADLRNYIQRLLKAASRPAASATAAAPAKPAPVQIDFSQWGSIVKKTAHAVAQGHRAAHVRKLERRPARHAV